MCTYVEEPSKIDPQFEYIIDLLVIYLLKDICLIPSHFVFLIRRDILFIIELSMPGTGIYPY